jgi:hypothetical protein
VIESNRAAIELYKRFGFSIVGTVRLFATGENAMKHAGAAALDALRELITAIRAHDGLKEPRPGVFFRKGRAWLHFHEDKAGLFADLRVGAEWERFRVSEAKERAKLLAVIDRAL